MTRKTQVSPLSAFLMMAALLTATWFASPLLARDSDDASLDYARYVVELLDPPLALYEGGELSVDGNSGPKRMAATAPQALGEAKLNAASPQSREYLVFLSERHQAFTAEVSTLLGRIPLVSHRYRMATNGLAMHLTADEAAILAESPLVRSVSQEVVYKLDTYAGPEWLGADYIWNGDAGYPAAGGEGIVVAVIDTGINWDHPSFDDNNYDYSNPLGEPLGLCSDPEVLCNGKLIGVYDFVEDDPSTEDWVEENTKGKDNNGHGSHTASTAVGSPVRVNDESASFEETISGVAPRANLVSYRVCYMGEPHSVESEGCSGAAILSAIDQAVEDGVDAINYSIGGDARNPWGGATADRAFLAARSAGIFVASSAGNTGPNESTVTSPAMAPWVVAVGNSSHNKILGNALENMSGGTLPAPEDMIGASKTDGTGKLVIVHAKDFGYPLCGVGEPELQPSCNTNTGASNPWAGSKPFNGEIVVCDRGLYGRIEKSKNLLQAGAGGYVLANTAEQGETVVADDHCLPGTHLGRKDGDELRTWLDAGTGHGAALSGLTLVELDSVADQLSFSSSRGPAIWPVEDTLKPNLIAPGTAILAAGDSGISFLTLTGTSMASPHVAGSAALIKSVHPDWNANQLASAIEMTATQELAKDENGQPATTEQVGAGRPQLDLAANAGLYLEVTAGDFLSANPAVNGDPKELNLPGLVDSRCKGECNFIRSVTDLMGGGSWTAEPVDFPEGTQVTITPASFNLNEGLSQELNIAVNVEPSGIVGDWVSGKIKLSASGSSDMYLTVSAFSYGGNLPLKWTVSSDSNGGWTEYGLTNLVALSSATFTSGGLAKPEVRTETLIEDPTNLDPYDGGSGVFTQWHNLPQGALWIYAETLASTAEDLDLFVGRDEDGDNRADEWEELCSSTTPQDLERCDLYNLPPGNYWILVQNWTGTLDGGDEVSLKHAAISESGSTLAASGPGIVAANAPFPVRLSWDSLAALPNETWLGAVGIGSNGGSPNNIGVIPVEFTRSGIAAAETFPLMDGKTHGLALAANGKHDRVFIDVPPSSDSLTITASGASAEQSNALTLELVRLDFDQGMSNPPFASPAGNGTVVVSATGSGGNGPVATVSGGVEPGRWYAVLSNGSSSPAAVEIVADVAFQGTPSEIHPGLWEPRSRPGLGQGYDYNWGGNSRALIWYTYDEAGLPQWFIAGAPEVGSNIWTTDILRFTNDGENQQSAPVGTLSITQLARDDALFTYTLFGKSGTERMMPISPLTCPQSGDSYTGIWYRGENGLGGASVLVNSSTQAQIHYLYDELGLPRWLYAQDVSDPNSSTFPILQFKGYCAVCDPADVGSVEVGTLGRSFDSEGSGSWTLDYMFDAPPNGSANRTDQVVKITHRLDCM